MDTALAEGNTDWRTAATMDDLGASGGSRALVGRVLCFWDKFAFGVVYQFAVQHQVPA